MDTKKAATLKLQYNKYSSHYPAAEHLKCG